MLLAVRVLVPKTKIGGIEESVELSVWIYKEKLRIPTLFIFFLREESGKIYFHLIIIWNDHARDK